MIFHVNVAFAVVIIMMGRANKTDWFLVRKDSRSLGGGYDTTTNTSRLAIATAPSPIPSNFLGMEPYFISN